MKVSIIAFNNLNKSPYVNIYSDFCQKNGIDYEIIFPNRSGISETRDCALVEIGWDASKHKMINFLKFRGAVIKHLKKAKPDFVIVLTTMPAVLLSGFLSRNYRGKYLVDVRDYTYENVSPYFMLEKKVIKNSAMNVISSPGFSKFLPEAEYTLCQNISEAYKDDSNNRFKVSEKEISIGYVGTIAYKNQCLKLIKLVEKDPRFRFDFYGDEGSDRRIAEYLEANPCDRIKTYGPYKPSEKVGIMENVDILFNAYGFGNKLVDYALSNKLYDSFYMRIPLLTSPNTAMSEEAGEFSFDIDFDKVDSLDGLYDWYRNIDADSFDVYSKKYLSGVFEAQDEFYKKLKEVLSDE